MTYELYLGDAYNLIDDILANIPEDKTVAIVTDPEYEFASSGGGKWRAARKTSNTITARKMDKGFHPSILLKPRIGSVVVFMHNDQVFNIGPVLKTHYRRAVLCGWLKKNPSPMANKNYQADSELYIHAWKEGCHPIGTLKDRKRFTVHGREKKLYDHPTVKPLDLMQKIVRAVNADIIIDPFMGSGTTGEACIIEGREFIGIEKDPEYFAMAEARLTMAKERHQKAALPSSND